jgi:cell division protein FtsB
MHIHIHLIGLGFLSFAVGFLCLIVVGSSSLSTIESLQTQIRAGMTMSLARIQELQQQLNSTQQENAELKQKLAQLELPSQA